MGNQTERRPFTLPDEPALRVGLILAEDALETVRVTVGGGGCRVDRGDNAGRGAAGGQLLEVSRRNGELAVRGAEVAAGGGVMLTLRPITECGLTAGAGMCVHDVPAGRGFHWATRRNVHVPGTLEVYADARGLVVVNVVPLEAYLAGVITAEMSGACPAALLEAQCIVARSWLLAMAEAKHVGEAYERCNDDCCQRYQGADGLSAAALAAVGATRGQVLLTSAGDVLDANYAKSCGGISEWARFVWGADKPGISAVVDAPAESVAKQFLPVTEANLAAYLDGAWAAEAGVFCGPAVVPVETLGEYLGRVDRVDDYFRWCVTLTADELCEHWRGHDPRLAEITRLRDLRVLERGVSGRIARLEVVGAEQTVVLASEYAIRAALHPRFLYSSAFATQFERDAAGDVRSVTLRGAGWGHGVGLCQIGALGMALRGYDSASICRHYYPQATLGHAYT